MISDNRKKRVGQVVGDKMDKTVVVAIERLQRHRLYRKSIKRISKLYAHDEQNDAKMGDTVLLMETRPISRLKRWIVAEILERHELPEVMPQEIGKDVEEELVKPTVSVSDEAVVEEVSDEAVVEEVSDEAVVEEVSDEAVVEEVSDEAVVEEVSDEAVVEDKPEKESS